MIDISKYVGRRFHYRKMNCVTIFNEAWKDLTGVDLQITNSPTLKIGDCFQHTGREMQRLIDAGVVEQIPDRRNPCMVTFLNDGKYPHVAVHIDGHLLHATFDAGSLFEPIEGKLAEDLKTAKYWINKVSHG